jgi:hypothetical protein
MENQVTDLMLRMEVVRFMTDTGVKEKTQFLKDIEKAKSRLDELVNYTKFFEFENSVVAA